MAAENFVHNSGEEQERINQSNELSNTSEEQIAEAFTQKSPVDMKKVMKEIVMPSLNNSYRQDKEREKERKKENGELSS